MAQQMRTETHVSFAHLNELFLPEMGDPAQQDAQNDSGKKMWTEYLREAEKYDNRIADSWKEDSNGILLFAGIFSATVGVFIIEFYKFLFRDEQLFVLQQILAQLQSQSSGGNSTSPTPIPPLSDTPPTAIRLVIAMWMTSLLLSLSSAVFATLLQQWARRYTRDPWLPSKPSARAHVRSTLFFGTITGKYSVYNMVEVAPALLHIAVFLFYAGLMIIFYFVDPFPFRAVTTFVAIFIVVYMVLSIHPFIYHDGLYHTPLSTLWWYASQFSLFSVSFCLYWPLDKLYHWKVSDPLGGAQFFRQLKLDRPVQYLGRAVQTYRQHVKDGFRSTTLRWALGASDSVDIDGLSWYLGLPALAEESKAQEFLARIPEETIVQLMRHPIQPGKPVLREHLLTLLRSCGPGPHALAVGLNENERKARLLVCLRTILCIAHAAATNPDSDIDVEFVRSNFADITRMRAMWVDSDPGIRVASRSICALLARCLLSKHEVPLNDSELRWLQDVTGNLSNMIGPTNIADRDRMNLEAFVNGVLSGQQGDLAAEHATSFTETLAILMDAGTQRPFNKTKFQEQLGGLIERIEHQPGGGAIADTLRQMFQLA